MKKIILTGTVSAILGTLTLASCQDESAFYNNNGGESGGRIVPTVFVDSSVKTSQSRTSDVDPLSRATEAQSITADDLTLKLIYVSDGQVAYTCKGVDNFDSEVKFKVGEYRLEASYGDINQEGFGLPAYAGNAEVVVEEDKQSSVSMTVGLANSMVSIVFGENLLNYATNVSAALQTTGEDIKFNTTEERAAYIKPGNTSVKVTLTKPNGVSGTLTAATFTAKAKTHHKVTIDLEGGADNVELTVTFDDTVEEKDVTIDLSDELINAPAPTVTLKGFNSDETVTFVAGQEYIQDLSMEINAQGGISKVVMSTSSAALVPNGWPQEIDLVSATAEQQGNLSGMGLDVVGLYKNPENYAIIDFCNVLKRISYQVSGNNDTKITVTVYDKANKSSDPVTLSLTAVPLELSLEAITKDFPGVGNDIELTLTYNGNDAKNDVSFTYLHRRGAYDNLEVKSIMPIEDETNKYKVIVVTPDVEAPLTIRAASKTDDKVLSEVEIQEVPFKLTVDERDVFATYAWLTVVITRDESGYDASTIAKDGTLKLTPDDEVTKSVEDATIKLTGLKPGTTYRASISYDDKECNIITFTTEEAKQLENGTFESESWNVTQKGDYQWLWSVTGWNSVNDITMESFGTGSGWSGSGFAYKATSGTIPANSRSNYSTSSGGILGTEKRADGHTNGEVKIHDDLANSGNNAALIRTVGYGSGNRPATNNRDEGFGTCEEVLSGELILGTKNNNEYMGISFTSRPSSLTFYYKYSPYGSSGDYGYMEAYVCDEEGNTISNKYEMQINEQSSYTQVKVEFTYGEHCNKASSILIRFKSSDNPGLSSDTNWLSGPGYNNVSGGEYVGSELYIDDIVLNY